MLRAVSSEELMKKGNEVVYMNVSAGSDKGRVRSVNEDSYYVSDAEITYLVVADGMGGHKGGQLASQTAIKSVKMFLTASRLKGCKSVRECLLQCVERANLAIYKKAALEDDVAGMGTTMVLFYEKDGIAHVANVGDSRCYHIHNGSIKQITKDHSVVQELYDNGTITRSEMKNHPNKNIITRALGTNFSVKCDVFKFNVKPDDGIILCSDGLSNMVDDEEILKTFLNTSNTDECVSELIDKANNTGGNDNITVIAAKL